MKSGYFARLSEMIINDRSVPMLSLIVMLIVMKIAVQSVTATQDMVNATASSLACPDTNNRCRGYGRVNINGFWYCCPAGGTIVIASDMRVMCTVDQQGCTRYALCHEKNQMPEECRSFTVLVYGDNERGCCTDGDMHNSGPPLYDFWCPIPQTCSVSFSWNATAWSSCDCATNTRTRNATCIRRDDKIVNSQFCTPDTKPATSTTCQDHDVTCCGHQCYNDGQCIPSKRECQCRPNFWKYDCSGEPGCDYSWSHHCDYGSCTNLADGDWICHSCRDGYSGDHCEKSSLVTYMAIGGSVIGIILIGVAIVCYRRHVAKRNNDHNDFALMTN